MEEKTIIRHGLMLLWFKDLMNVNEEVTMHKPNVSIHLSSAFIISFSWKFQGFKDSVNTETSRRENFFATVGVKRLGSRSIFSSG